MKAELYSLKGKKVDSITLPTDWKTGKNLNLIAQAVHVYEEKSHKGMAKTQTRAEVARTKKKLFKQKGTGNARHGARSAPIFVGGGVALGPRPVRRAITLPSKMRKKALLSSLALKAQNGEVILMEDISKIKKTKEAQVFLDEIKNSKPKTFILKDMKANKALRNLEDTKVKLFRDLNSFDVIFGGTLIFDSGLFTKPKQVKKPVKKAVKKVTKK